MARRIGDPALLSQALADLHLAPATPAEWAARVDAADEIVALGERLGRPDVALLGYEWQFGERLGRADLPGAQDALARLELYARLSSAPRWRFAAGLRRATLVSLAGERERCLQRARVRVRERRPVDPPGGAGRHRDDVPGRDRLPLRRPGPRARRSGGREPGRRPSSSPHLSCRPASRWGRWPWVRTSRRGPISAWLSPASTSWRRDWSRCSRSTSVAWSPGWCRTCPRRARSDRCWSRSPTG